jgi:threonine dehydrogenase-like Zn-dependent dehydrogenase
VTLDQEDAIDRTDQFTHQRGLDASVFAFGGDGEKAYKQTLRCLKSSPDGHRMGRIVIVGGSRFPLQWDALNVDIRFAARTGPGYHDDRWEHGQDYPPVFMRWTTQTNLDLCMHLIAEGRLNVDVLTTHIVRLDEVKQRVNDMLTSSEEILGVVFDMKG